MATDELKPCPFCGSKPEPHWTFAANWVECHECGAVVDCEGSIEETFAAWNRRVTPGVSGRDPQTIPPSTPDGADR
jgi:hypothetical protein